MSGVSWRPVAGFMFLYMKKITSVLFVVAFVSLLIFPQTVSAAWWNPLSWFGIKISVYKPKFIPAENKPISPTKSTDTTIISTKPTPTPKPISVQRQENKTQLQEASKNLSNKNIIQKVKPAVVYIQTSDGSGSGMIIEKNGYVLTNAHVVTGVNSATVKLSDGRSLHASIIGRDENLDLAIIKIDATNLPIVEFGNSDSIEQGDEVFTLGYPFGLEGDVSFKNGTISRRLTLKGSIYLETSAEIHPGNSGGPLVDRSARVVGINSAAWGAGSVEGIIVGESIKLAIPINVAKENISSLKSGRNIILPRTTPKPYIPPPTKTPPPQSRIPQMDPKISNIQVENVFMNSATVGWDWHSLYIDVVLEYGTNPNLIGSKTINTGIDGVVIGSLIADTTYYFRVNSKNSVGEEFHSGIMSFKTLPKPTPLPTPTPTPIPTPPPTPTPTPQQTLSISVDLGSNNPASTDVRAGSKDVNSIEFKLTNRGLEDIRVESVPVNISSDQVDVEAAHLYSEGSNFGVVSICCVSQDLGVNSSLIIEAGSSKILSIKVDIRSELSGNRYYDVQIAPTNIIARGLSSGKQVPWENITSSKDIRGNKMHIID